MTLTKFAVKVFSGDISINAAYAEAVREGLISSFPNEAVHSTISIVPIEEDQIEWDRIDQQIKAENRDFCAALPICTMTPEETEHVGSFGVIVDDERSDDSVVRTAKREAEAMVISELNQTGEVDLIDKKISREALGEWTITTDDRPKIKPDSEGTVNRIVRVHVNRITKSSEIAERGWLFYGLDA